MAVETYAQIKAKAALNDAAMQFYLSMLSGQNIDGTAFTLPISANLTATAIAIEDGTTPSQKLAVDSLGRITIVSSSSQATPSYTFNAVGTAITASATGSAAASTTATLAGTSGKTTYITGFSVTTGAATGAVVGLVTVAGVITATMSYQYQQETAAGNGLAIAFPTPVPASGTNTAIVVNIAAAVNGGVTAVNATGFQL